MRLDSVGARPSGHRQSWGTGLHQPPSHPRSRPAPLVTASPHPVTASLQGPSHSPFWGTDPAQAGARGLAHLLQNGPPTKRRPPGSEPESHPGLCAADEMLYDDVENGDEAGNSSLEDGWSSSEFESYGEQSDSECKNGVPRPFLRGGHKKQVSFRSVRLGGEASPDT